MYEEAFELGERSFDEQFKKEPTRKIKFKPAEETNKLPSLLKGDDNNRSNLRSGKLKPIDDKLQSSRMNEKQNFIQANNSGNVYMCDNIDGVD